MIVNGEYSENEQWNVTAQLGQGSFGACFSAHDVNTNTDFCVKKVKKNPPQLSYIHFCECVIASIMDYNYVTEHMILYLFRLLQTSSMQMKC